MHAAGQDRDLLVWDALQRTNFDLTPQQIDPSLGSDADLVWLDSDRYLLFASEGADLLSAESSRCAMLGNSVNCDAFFKVDDYAEPGIGHIAATAIHGGVVVATTARQNARTQIRIRVFDVNFDQGDTVLRPVDSAAFDVTDGRVLAFDVAATYVESDLYAAVAYINAPDNASPGTVELRGYHFVDMLPETR
jgi:hypothetical protein